MSGELSPLVDWDGLPVELVDTPRALTPRAADGRATVLVNAVGATGSYGHVVVRAPHAHGTGPAAQDGPAGPGPRVGEWSAHRRPVGRFARGPHGGGRAAARPSGRGGPALCLDDVAWTLQTGRASLGHRLTLSADGLDGVRAGLTAFLDGRPCPGLATAAADPALAGVPADAQDLARAAGDWLRGHVVDFARLWSAPARRVPLPVQDFTVLAQERHWLAAPAARRPDGAAGSAPAAPESGQSAPPASPQVQDDRADRADRAQEHVAACFAEVSGIPAEQLHPRVPLEHYGLSSRLVARFNERLRQDVQGVSSTVLFEYPDLAGVAAHLAAHHEGPWSAGPDTQPSPPVPSPDPLPVTRTPAAALGESAAADGPEPIAVIGIAGRYPGAGNLEAFWSNLAEGVDGPLRTA